MEHVVLVAVLLATVSAVVAPYVQEQSGPQLQCRSATTSAIKVVMRTHQNRTGNWESKIGVKQAMDSAGGGEADQWLVDVEQVAETCEDETDSWLETVFYLTTPSARGRHSKRPPRDREPPTTTTTPVSCAYPSCPKCPTIPNCPPPTPCPDTTAIPDYFKSDLRGYEHYPGVGTYKVSLSAETWLEAKRTCEYDGAHLLILNSQEEENAIKSLLNHYPTATGSHDNKHIFLGAQRIGTTYYTVLGKELATSAYVKWQPGQPGGGSEYCLTVHRPQYLSHDITCSVRLGFVCEKFPKT